MALLADHRCCDLAEFRCDLGSRLVVGTDGVVFLPGDGGSPRDGAGAAGGDGERWVAPALRYREESSPYGPAGWTDVLSELPAEAPAETTVVRWARASHKGMFVLAGGRTRSQGAASAVMGLELNVRASQDPRVDQSGHFTMNAIGI